MLDSAVHDTATLRVTTGPLDREDVITAFRHNVDELRKTLETDDRLRSYRAALSDIRIEVNVVTDRAGSKFGYAFVHVKPPALYHLLLGRKPDGTINYEEMPDPDWFSDPVDFDWENYTIDGVSTDDVKATALYKEWLKNEDLDSSDANVYGSSENQAQFKDYLRSRHEPRMIKVEEPILQVASLEYTPEQYRLLIAKARELGKDPKTVPTFHTFTITAASVSHPEDKDLNPYTLRSNDVPTWVTDESIRDVFAPYNTDQNVYSRTMTDSTHGRHQREIVYPVVRKCQREAYRDGKPIEITNIFVEFSKALAHKHDAAVARRMCRQVQISNPETGEICTILFDFWREHARDSTVPFERGPARVGGYGAASGIQRKVHGTKPQRPGLFKPAPSRR